MAVEKMTENVEVVQTLSTYPNQEEGLSAEQLKAKFDQGPKALKEYLNNVLVPAVQGIQNAMEAGAQYGLDTTLSVPGRAADAAAVGTALASKAPAGLVTKTIKVAVEEALNNALSEEFATMAEDSVRFIVVSPTSGALFGGVGMLCELYKRSSSGYGTAKFTGYGANSPDILYKTLWAGTWQPLEWVNPPMHIGVEYRTTERFNGEVVYRKLVVYKPTESIGSPEGSVDISIPHGISNLKKGLACQMTLDNKYVFPYPAPSGCTAVTQIVADSIAVRIINDTWGVGDWYFDLAYTKS